ncbi:MAG: hypothetical protein KGZ39_02305 [Simkania sp.]|nr:hypothetical protein [Simkania sp.]
MSTIEQRIKDPFAGVAGSDLHGINTQHANDHCDTTEKLITDKDKEAIKERLSHIEKRLSALNGRDTSDSTSFLYQASRERKKSKKTFEDLQAERDRLGQDLDRVRQDLNALTPVENLHCESQKIQNNALKTSPAEMDAVAQSQMGQTPTIDPSKTKTAQPSQDQIDTLQRKKKELKARLLTLNGTGFGDPNSLLHQASQQAKKDQKAFDDLRSERNHLQQELLSLKQGLHQVRQALDISTPSSEAKYDPKPIGAVYTRTLSIQPSSRIDPTKIKQAQPLQDQSSAHSNLLRKKAVIKARLSELEGTYYEDPNSLLHQAFQQVKKDQKAFDDLRSERDRLQQTSKEPIQDSVKTRLSILNGKGFGDPDSLLHQASQQAGKSQKAFSDLQSEWNRLQQELKEIRQTLNPFTLAEAPKLDSSKEVQLLMRCASKIRDVYARIQQGHTLKDNFFAMGKLRIEYNTLLESACLPNMREEDQEALRPLIEDVERLLQEQENAALVFKAHPGPLPSFLLNITHFNRLSSSETRASELTRAKGVLLRSFASLPEEDQTLFAQCFYSVAFQSTDANDYRATFVKKNYPDYCSPKFMLLEPAIRATLVDTILTALFVNPTMSDKEKITWTYETLLDKPEELQQALQIFSHEKSLNRHSQIQETGGFPTDELLSQGPSDLDKEHRQRILDDVKETLSTICTSQTNLVRFFKHVSPIKALREGHLSALSSVHTLDIMYRAEKLEFLDSCKKVLSENSPTLALAFSNAQHPLFKLWKEKELFLLFHPINTTEQEVLNMRSKIEGLFHALEALNQPLPESRELEPLLEILLRRYSFHSNSSEISNAIELKGMQQRSLPMALGQGLPTSGLRIFKDIYQVPSQEPGIKTAGKYKPNQSPAIAREVVAYSYDTIIGCNMTAATTHANLSTHRALVKIQTLLKQSHTYKTKAKEFEISGNVFLSNQYLHRAHLLHVEAMNLCQLCNSTIKDGLFICAATMLGKKVLEKAGKDTIDLWHSEKEDLSDETRVLIIDDYLRSQYYKKLTHTTPYAGAPDQGSLQKWINAPSTRVHDLVREHPQAGEELKQVPKTLVHEYCLLGMIKGSIDCSTGNTMVTLTPTGQITNFIDFDDERCMPTANHFKQIRMWQLGLPQANLPFDRATLLMFSDPLLHEQIKRYNAMKAPSILPKESLRALEERLGKIKELFELELKKRMPELTPRDLFFAIFGGKEQFTKLHQDQHILPIDIFDFHMGGYGGGVTLTTSNPKKATVLKNNLENLYIEK